MPVPPLVLGALGPGDDMWRGGPDLLVTAWTAIGLRRPGRGDVPHHPRTIGMLLDCRGRSPQRSGFVDPTLGPAWTHTSVSSDSNGDGASAADGMAAASAASPWATVRDPIGSSISNGPSG